MTTQPTPISTHHHAHLRSGSGHRHEARCMCPSVDATEPPLVDVRDMLVVHTALLREFRLAPDDVRRVSPGDRHRSAHVTRHLRLIGDMLHHHHEGEDELLWPLLAARAPTHAQALADGEAQHAALDTALGEVAQARETWAAAPTAESRDTLADRLETLSRLLRDHLALEERDLLPVAAAVLQPEEWALIGARAAAALPKPALALAFGMFAYEGDPAVLAPMLEQAPPPARVLLPRLAPRLYARRARQVHGTPRP